MEHPCTEIEITDLSFSYGNKKIFTHFSASIPMGECSAVMARSGTGKTTLLHLIAGVLQPMGGSIHYAVDKPKFSVVFQENRLLEHCSVWKNLYIINHDVTKTQALEALSEVGLSAELLHKKAGKLSGGEQRRVAIVRALLADYDILLLDEPFTNLDEDSKAKMMRYVKTCNVGKTVLLVTHDEEEAQALGSRKILHL